MKRRVVGVVAVALMAGVAAMGTQARASVTVIGGGLAESCSKAAQAGKPDQQAEATCTESLEKDMLNSRDRAGTYVNRGVLRMRRLNWAGAVQDFNEAMRLRPDMGEAYVNRGAVSIGEHHYAESLPDLNKGLALGVEEPAKVYYNRALAYEGLDDEKSAYFDYQKALELNPGWDAPKTELARFHVERRE
jgi:tetratricopeptide (TPR) repeat protein